jgi:hypothetical protein
MALSRRDRGHKAGGIAINARLADIDMYDAQKSSHFFPQGLGVLLPPFTHSPANGLAEMAKMSGE